MPIIIAGPTGSGKSALALRLAKKYNGEIICADSRQFYSFMEIGTAAPTKADKGQVPHHGFSCFDPACTKLDAGSFVEYAKKTIAQVQSRGRRPFLVGGTGLYLRALRYGLGDVPKASREIALNLEKRCDEEGLASLYSELVALDPQSGKFIEANDRYRIIRALEIYENSGQTPSSCRQSFKNGTAKLKAHWLLLKPERSYLQERLKSRVKKMFEQGLVNETKALLLGFGPNHWSLQVMGYFEASQYLREEISLEQAMERVLIRHRQYAKRQLSWFNKEDFYLWQIKSSQTKTR